MKDTGVAIESREDYVPKRPRRHRDETGRLGKEIYQKHIRHEVEPEHVGKIVAIDVDSSSWAMGESVTEAVDRLRKKRPKAVDVFCERAGYEAVGSIGGGYPRRTDWSKE